MIYLKTFRLPTHIEEEAGNSTPQAYPFGIFPFKRLEEIILEPITVFYGSNGSGKSTLLNIISEKLKLPRTTLFNSSPLFSKYVEEKCSYTTGSSDDDLSINIPLGSKIITSEDVFNYILNVRNENVRINKNKIIQREKYYEAKYSKIHFGSMDDLERVKTQTAARKQTATKFITDRVGKNIDQFSNGETSLTYFDKQFNSGCLYLLDEPENSLSPKFQLQLSQLIIDCAYHCDCQFIIATHSPFILSITDAKIYDLDYTPVKERKWYDLENVKIYYEFFHNNRKYFEAT